MKPAWFEVLSKTEIEKIHTASMQILAEVGIKVEYPFAVDLLTEAGASYDEASHAVRIPETLVMWAVEQAPAAFSLYGLDGQFKMDVGGENIQFAGLGTPTRIVDMETGDIRPTVLEDTIRHIQLVNSCKYIHNSQMDVWPNDIPMTTIHIQGINAWAHHSRKPFGMGGYGYLASLDMMHMMAIAVGGKAALQQRPSFLGITSVHSPLQMTQEQIEGMLIFGVYGQPTAVSPEAIAGATAPVTLAGLLAQQNANILAHITLAQIWRPGAPVLYGTVSTIANMRLGTVALGAVETGLITAASAQLARYYGLPSRSVGGATESKLEDVQAGMERTSTLLPAVLAGVNLITCGGTLDSTMIESDPLLLLDDELCGAALRLARGIEVNDETLALDDILRIGFSGNYLAEEHTVRHFRQEHYIPSLPVREPFEAWQDKGSKNALDNARERVRMLLEKHIPNELDPGVEKALTQFEEETSARQIETYYACELPENQDWESL
jgi:trimethylamine--corrinoid protein Co-methyltransferase